LIDELDRADEEFEAFLLEFLGEFQISIPEVGTLKASKPPFVVLTSNRTRDVHDALKRRCLYHWIDLPSFEKELAIVKAKAPEAGPELTRQVTAFMQKIRQAGLVKRPGVSETLDWAQALVLLGATSLDKENVDATLGCILKHQEDLRWFRNQHWQDKEARAAFLAALND
jgi:MoxR-like ATPase